jgi:hypothetical protein
MEAVKAPADSESDFILWFKHSLVQPLTDSPCLMLLASNGEPDLMAHTFSPVDGTVGCVR